MITQFLVIFLFIISVMAIFALYAVKIAHHFRFLRLKDRKKPGTKPKGKNDLVAFHFPGDTLMLTEAGKKHRAAIYCFDDPLLSRRKRT